MSMSMSMSKSKSSPAVRIYSSRFLGKETARSLAPAVLSPQEEGTPKSKRRRCSAYTSSLCATSKVVSSPSVVTSAASSLQTHESLVPDVSNAADTDGGGFQDLCIAPSELRPSATLTTGQCFHWSVVRSDNDGNHDQAKRSAWGSHDATEWIGVLRVPICGDNVVIVLKETPTTVYYRTLCAPTRFDVKSFLFSYFQVADDTVDGSRRPSLEDLYGEWSAQCDRLQQIAVCIPGVRVVDQDPWECLVSFLCSSNNNIPRISKMLNAIRREYGDPLVSLSCLGPGKSIDSVGDGMIYSFPSLERLRSLATDKDLRSKCGMGYRAKYLMETMNILESLGGEPYLQKLRLLDDPDAVQKELTQFCGVGRKVADCIALFSLRQSRAIPVDVHVWNMALRDYGAGSLIRTTKSLTPTVYNQIGDLFRSRFPNRSGWAHSLLFVAELPSFREILPADMINEMDDFRTKAKAKKAELKKLKS